jgi:hypothetical protein
MHAAVKARVFAAISVECESRVCRPRMHQGKRGHTPAKRVFDDMTSSNSTSTHRSTAVEILVGVSVIIVASAIYGVGLISPLTPSKGVPSLIEILLWFVIPLVLLFFGYRTVKIRLLRIAIVTELVFVFCTGALLLVFLFVTVRL